MSRFREELRVIPAAARIIAAVAFVAVTAGRDARTREVTLTAKGANALKRAEPYWKRAQKDVARRVGKPKLEALITILGELESLHPHHEEAAD